MRDKSYRCERESGSPVCRLTATNEVGDRFVVADFDDDFHVRRATLAMIASFAGSGLEASASAFGAVAHAGQQYGDRPYVVHLADVRGVLAEFGFTGSYLAAAWLHDVLEDTSVTYEVLSAIFPKLADLVWAVTGQGRNRKERTADAMDKLRNRSEAIPLKLADRIANVRISSRGRLDLFTMYASEHDAFEAVLRPRSDPNDGRETAMWLELDRMFRAERGVVRS